MNRKKVIHLLIIFLLMIETSLVFLMYKSFDNRNISENKTVNNKINRKRFAMYKLNDSGEYEEITDTTIFPTGYILNMDRTICVDNNGEEVTTNIQSVNNKVMVTSGQTIYCTLYFDPKTAIFIAVSTDGVDGVASTAVNNTLSLSCSTGATPFWNNKWSGIAFSNTSTDEEKCTLEYIDDNTNHSSALLSTAITNNATDETSNGVGYRYEGANPNNYIWFNNELWRIIGLIPTKTSSNGNTENLIKIVRNDPLGFLRFSEVSPAENWNQTGIYTVLNDYYYNSEDASSEDECVSYRNERHADCDYTEKGLKNEAKALIKNVYWNTGIVGSNDTPKQAYDDEVLEQLYTGYVGLMNISDFGFASSVGRTDMSTFSSGTNYLINDWIYKGVLTWVITKNTYNANTITAINVGNMGRANSRAGGTVYPVVYLDNETYVISGNGAENNPFIVSK